MLVIIHIEEETIGPGLEAM